MARIKKKRNKNLQGAVASGSSELCQRMREFVEWLRVKNFAARTVEMRRQGLNVFGSWCSEREINQVSQLNKQLIEHYEKYLLHKKDIHGKAMSALNRYAHLTALSKFGWWLAKYDYARDNPAEKITYPRIVKKLPKHVPSHSQIEQILMQPDITKPRGLRDRTIMELLYSTGLRRAEAIGLKVEDIDLTNKVVYVRHGKGGKSRVVPLGERAKQWLEKYIFQARPVFVRDQEQRALFVSNLGTALTIYGLSCQIRSHVRQAGQSGTCHIFRHAMATEMLNAGADIRHIQEMLGHESIATTQIYTHTSLQRLQQVYQSTHPASKGSTSGIAEPVIGSVAKRSREYTKIELAKGTSQLSICIEQFAESLELANYSPVTIKKYSHHLHNFEYWCKEQSVSEPKQIKETTLELFHKFIASRQTKGTNLSCGYIKEYLQVIKQFCTFLVDNAYTAYNVGCKLEYPRTTKRIPCQILSALEVAAILEQAHTTSPLGLRDRAVMEVLYATGVRQAELIAIKLADVDFEQKTLRVTKGKGSKQRIVPIAQNALEWLAKYIAQVRPMLIRESPCELLFLSSLGRPLDTESFNKRLQKFAKAAGVRKACTCHKLRHAMATAMLDAGADIRSVQEILGHANLQSTQIYTKVAIRKLKEVHAQTHPARSREQKEACQNK